MRQRLCRLGFLACRYIWRHWSRRHVFVRAGGNRTDIACIAVGKELVQHALDRSLSLLGPCVAHIIVLESRVDHGDTSLVALLSIRNHAGIGLELRILRTE